MSAEFQTRRPVACGIVDTEPKVSMRTDCGTPARRSADRPMPGVESHDVRLDVMDVQQLIGAAAEWSTTRRPPTSCNKLVDHLMSVTDPTVDDADGIATRRAGAVIRLSHRQVGNSPHVSMSTRPT